MGLRLAASLFLAEKQKGIFDEDQQSTDEQHDQTIDDDKHLLDCKLCLMFNH